MILTERYESDTFQIIPIEGLVISNQFYGDRWNFYYENKVDKLTIKALDYHSTDDS